MSDFSDGIIDLVNGISAPIVKTGCGLIENLLGKPCSITGELISDQIVAWKWRNRVRIAEKVDRIIKEKAIAARVLPPDFFVPYLEAIGDVDDPTLQDLWASLLASAISEDVHARVSLVRILDQLDSVDAKILLAFHEGPVGVQTCVSIDEGFPDSWKLGEYKVSPNLKGLKGEETILSLIRLNHSGLMVLFERFENHTHFEKAEKTILNRKSKKLFAHPTTLCDQLLRVCSGIKLESGLIRDTWSESRKLYTDLSGLSDSAIAKVEVEQMISASTGMR